jgi:hypothetical protein
MAGPEKDDLLIQVTALIEVTTWAGLSVFLYELNVMVHCLMSCFNQ